ncbi:TonB-dependent receptor [bacterium]|jgi:hypothetical protein|nr:TonB-dependent receptor [bacterium]
MGSQLMRNSNTLKLLYTSLFLVANMLQSVAAQDGNADEDTTVMFPASYFTEYSPVNARDMLDRIPGVGSTTGGGPNGGNSGRSDRGGRGFGSGSGSSEILINGKRTAGKNNQTRNLLRRISAEQVNYIELIRGTSGDLDVRGSAQVVNVVLFEELSDSSVSYEANMDRYRDGKNQPGGSITYSSKIGGLDFVLGAVAEPRYNHSESDEYSILGDFSPNDMVRIDSITDQLSRDLSANLEYEFNAKNSARFNALYSENDNPTDLTRQTTDLTVTPNSILSEREDIPGERDNWEIGGDYEHISDQGSRFKVLFISNQDNRAATRERYEVASDGSETKNLFLDSSSTFEEQIIRGSYTFDIFENQDIEIGAERAQTTLDSKLALGLADTTGTPSPDFGGLVPVTISNANSQVEEIRYEPFAIHNWVINSRMSLESTLLYETSEISQSGDVSKKRDFDFLKPKVDYRFDLTPTLQLRGSIEKRVSQLSFNDFVASTDEQDDDSNTLAGNANLTQMWFWKYDFNAEYRLPNDAGVVDANIYYHDHHDMIDRIDVSPSEDDLQSAAGNIGDGTMYGLRLNASVRMNMINMPNLLVSSQFNVADSKITDPFLGIERRFANFGRGRWTLSFRHDLPQWNANYGASWSNRFDDNQKRYDIDDVVSSVGEPNLSVFLEFIAFGGTTFRFDVRDLSNNLQCRERTRYLGRISAGIIEEIEDQCSSRGRVASLKISGTY